MERDDWVLFYEEAVRNRFPNVDFLFEQNASLGQVKTINTDTITVYFESRYGSVPLEEDVPKRYVRLAREVYWYEFFRRKGFHTNLYGYGFAVIFFLLFVK